MSSVTDLPAFYKNFHRDLEPVQPGIGHFNILKIEELELPGQKPVSYSRRDFFKVSLVIGQGIIHYADRSVAVDGPVLVFTNPMIPFFWERISEKQVGFVCIFTEAFLGHNVQVKDFPAFQQASAGILKLDEVQAVAFNQSFEKMYAELQGDYAFKYDLLRIQLMELVHQAQKLQPLIGQPVNKANAAERITRLFAELLERQFPIELSGQVFRLRKAVDFARQLNVHVNHLNKALKTITGHTTMQLIADRVLQEACLLLKSTDWTIAEIAFCLGFEEANHFSAFFKKRTGQRPLDFRKI